MNGNSNEISGRGEKPKDVFVVKGSNIRIWIHDKDVAKLTKVLWAGQGNRLRAEASNNPKVRRFLDTVPNVLNSIREVHKAVVENDLEILQLLMEPRSVPRSLITSKDQNGLTVMHKAAGLAHTMIIEYLVQNWPDGVNECDATGKTPLHWAASIKNNTRCYNLLVQAGADEEALDYRMKVPNYYRQKPGEIDRSLLTILPDAPRVAQDSYPEWSALIDEPDFVYKPENKWGSRGSDIMGDRFTRSREISFDNTSEPDMDDREGKQIAEEALKAAMNTENNNEEENVEANSESNENEEAVNETQETKDEEEGEAENGNDIFSREASPILEDPAEEKNSEEPETAEVEDGEEPDNENYLEESEIVNSTEPEKTVDEDMSVSKVGTEEDQQNQSGDEGDCDKGENEKTELPNMRENPEQQQYEKQTISDQNIEPSDNTKTPGGPIENEDQTFNEKHTNLNDNEKYVKGYEDEGKTTQEDEEKFEKEKQNHETEKETSDLEEEAHDVKKEDEENTEENESKEGETKENDEDNNERNEEHSEEENQSNEEKSESDEEKHVEVVENQKEGEDEKGGKNTNNNMDENLKKEIAVPTNEELISNEMNTDENLPNEEDHLEPTKIIENGKHDSKDRDNSPFISENGNESTEEHKDASNHQISNDDNSKEENNGEINDHIKDSNPTEIRNWVNQSIQNEEERTPITREKTFINNLENEKNIMNSQNYATDEEDDDDQVHVGTL